MYRISEWRKEERAIERLKKRSEWFGRDSDSVVFVQATPDGVLRKELMKIIKQEGWKIRVCEVSGRSLKDLLQRSDVGKAAECQFDDCVICTSGKKGCNLESVGYKVTCLQCAEDGVKAVVHGETGRCARVRCGEHRDLVRKKKGSLWPHCRDVHNGEVPDFSYEVQSSFKDVLLRQIDEANRIRAEDGLLINNKEEWVRPAGFQLLVERM